MADALGRGRSAASRTACGTARIATRKPPRRAGSEAFVGLDSVQAIRPILEMVTMDTLGLENSTVRSRTLISAAIAAARLLETGELEARIATLEAAIRVGREPRSDNLFPDEAA